MFRPFCPTADIVVCVETVTVGRQTAELTYRWNRWCPVVVRRCTRIVDGKNDTSPPTKCSRTLPHTDTKQHPAACDELAHQSITSTAPTYLSADIQLVSEHGRRHLRSSFYRTLAVPRTRTTLGDRSFAVARPRVWTVDHFTGYYMYKTDHQLRTV